MTLRQEVIAYLRQPGEAWKHGDKYTIRDYPQSCGLETTGKSLDNVRQGGLEFPLNSH